MKKLIRIPTGKLFTALFASLWLSFLALTAQASTILQVGITDLLNESQFVFHGRVVEKWTDIDQSSNTIFTHVRMAIDDAIKGTYKQESIVLKFMGGTYGQQTLEVFEMNVPIVGEEGIYFVERTNRVQVNPFFGWHQGHFVVRYANDGRTKLIMTHDLRPIYELQPAQHTTTMDLSTGIPLGVRTDERPGDSPLSLALFKTRLKEISEVLK